MCFLVGLAIRLHKTLDEVGEMDQWQLDLFGAYLREYNPDRQWDRRIARLMAQNARLQGVKNVKEENYMPETQSRAEAQAKAAEAARAFEAGMMRFCVESGGTVVRKKTHGH